MILSFANSVCKCVCVFIFPALGTIYVQSVWVPNRIFVYICVKNIFFDTKLDLQLICFLLIDNISEHVLLGFSFILTRLC